MCNNNQEKFADALTSRALLTIFACMHGKVTCTKIFCDLFAYGQVTQAGRSIFFVLFMLSFSIFFARVNNVFFFHKVLSPHYL